MTRQRLVLFDCDGTLVDSQNLIVAAMTSAFAAHGHRPPARAAILSVVGLSLEQAVAAADPELAAGAVPTVARAYREAFGELRADPANAEPMFPGARAVLDTLAGRDDVVLGIATGKSMRGVRHLLEREALQGHFVTIQTADDSPSKPHPAMVLQAVADIGVEVEETVVVGDTSYDIEMARAAGAHPLGVAWGYHAPAALKTAGARRVLARFDELIEVLPEVWSAPPD